MPNPLDSSRTALVFGASGVSGWRTLQELLVYPSPTTFSHVIGLTNRPLTREDARLPHDPRLQLVSGIDLTASSSTVIRTMKDRIRVISEITHVYFYAYIHKPAFGKSAVDANCELLDNALIALKTLCPRLEHVILQTGTKYYGAEHIPHIVLPPIPWKETLPRVREPYASKIFYYRQVDILQRHARGASWKWTEVRPDVIVGYAPTSNAMNLAVLLAIFLTLWRAVHGKGSVVPFPGPKIAYTRTHTQSPMKGSSHFEIFASLKGDQTERQAFNIGAPASTYEKMWPQFANAFGLVGTPPLHERGINIEKWVLGHKYAWHRLERKHGLKPGLIESSGWDFLWTFSYPHSRDLDTTRSREIGFTERMDAVESYSEAWAEMARAKLIPPI